MNVKTTEPIESNFFVATHMTQGGFMNGRNLKNVLSKKDSNFSKFTGKRLKAKIEIEIPRWWMQPS